MTNYQTFLGFIGGLFIGLIVSLFKNEMDKDKARFDFRVEILREVWSAVFRVVSLAKNLAPELNSGSDPNEPWLQRRDRLIGEFLRAKGRARRRVLLNKPFYPVELFDLANEVITEAHMRASHFKNMGGNPTQEYYAKSEAHTRNIEALSERLCNAIRREVNGINL